MKQEHNFHTAHLKSNSLLQICRFDYRLLRPNFLPSSTSSYSTQDPSVELNLEFVGVVVVVMGEDFLFDDFPVRRELGGKSTLTLYYCMNEGATPAFLAP